MQEHRKFLDDCYDKNLFIASGPTHPRTGGIILAKGELSDINEIIKNDPFYQQDIAEYHLITFDPTKRAEQLSDFFGK